MLEKVPVIKAKFEMIKVVLGGKLSIEDLMYPKYLKILVDALENTYLQLNDEICESLVMCKECAQKRDILMQYIDLLDNFEPGSKVGPEVEAELEKFPKTIDMIIDRINAVLNESNEG